MSEAGALCAPQARPTPVVSEPRRQGCKQASGRRENPAPSAPSPHRRRASRRNSGRRRGARGSLTEEGESGHRRTPPLPGRVGKKRLEPWGGPVLPHVRGVRRFLSLVALLWSVSLVTGDRCLPGGPLEQVPGSTLRGEGAVGQVSPAEPRAGGPGAGHFLEGGRCEGSRSPVCCPRAWPATRLPVTRWRCWRPPFSLPLLGEDGEGGAATWRTSATPLAVAGTAAPWVGAVGLCVDSAGLPRLPFQPRGF